MKILEETPEIKHLEVQLGMAKKTGDPLDAVIADLKKITDVSTMVKEKEDLEKKADAKAASEKKAADAASDKKKEEKKADEKLPAAKTKTTADGKKQPVAAAPSKGGAPATGKVPEVTGDEKAKADAKAQTTPAAKA